MGSGCAPPMVVFVITQQVPPILAVALLIVVYLTVLELWHEDDLEFLWKAFWVLFVFPRARLRLRHLQGLAGAPPPRQERRLVPAHAVQSRHLERQLERKQVLVAQVEPGDALDSLEPLAHRVGVDVQSCARSPATLQRAPRKRSSVSTSWALRRRSYSISSSTACP